MRVCLAGHSLVFYTQKQSTNKTFIGHQYMIIKFKQLPAVPQ